MLWHKSWLETRWRFVIGLVLLMCSAAVVVSTYPSVAELIPLAQDQHASGELGRRIREVAELSRDYRGYVWLQWFSQQQLHLWTLFAVLLGTGGLMSQAARGGALFTLSLPVSRRYLLAVRAATGLAELAALAVVPSVLLVVLSPAIGQRYPLGDAVIHGLCLFAAGSVFFSLAFVLSTMFGDVWRPLLIALVVAIFIGLSATLFRDLSRFSVFSVMNAERYFRGNGLPWLGILASTAVSVALLYAATRNIARQDF